MGARHTAAKTEEYWATAPAHVHRCTGTVQSGERCRRPSLTGSPVCKQHGGAAPQTLAKAATRIGMSVDAAVKRLLEMLDDPKVETREKVKILHDLLDRGGLGATNKVLVGIGQADHVETFFRDLLSDPAILMAPVPEPKTPEQLERERREMLEAGFTPPGEPRVIEATARVVEDVVDDPEDLLGMPMPAPWHQGPRVARSRASRRDGGPADAPEHIREGFARLADLDR